MGVVALEAAAVAVGDCPLEGGGFGAGTIRFLARLQELGLESWPVPICTHDAGDDI